MASHPAARVKEMAEQRSPSPSSGVAGWMVWVATTAAVFLLVEGFLFREGWYYKYFEPNSSAGWVELHLYWLRRFQPKGKHEVLVVGDSRIAEGFSARQATEISQKRNLYFWNMGIAGSPPRVWYYVLRDADPSRRRFEAIVLAMDHYAEEETFDSMPARLIDLNFVIARLRLADAWDFASTMKTPEQRREAVVGALLKGTVMKYDARAFLEDIRGRITKAKDWREHGLDYYLGYPGLKRDLRGLTADWQARTLHYPPGLSQADKDSIHASLMPSFPPQSGEMTRYRFEWLGRIVALYRNSPTRIIFIEMPRGPLPHPERKAPTKFLDWARTQPNVSVIDQTTFRDLETTDRFFDGMHMNRIGRTEFTARLAENVQELLPAH